MRTPRAQQNPQAIDSAVKALDARLGIADDQLAKHSYVAGDDFTLADIQLGHMLYRYYDIDRADLTHLNSYYQRICEKPMYSKHVMISYEALRA